MPLVSPHGGKLQNLISRDLPFHASLVKLASTLPTLVLNARQTCDVELLMTGAFSPLDGFMSEKDYNLVRDDMRLSSGLVWTIPITLDVSAADITRLHLDSSNPNDSKQIVLVDGRDDNQLAILTVEDVYLPDKVLEAERVYGKNDQAHPGVKNLFATVKEWYIGGSLQALSTPIHHDYLELRKTPTETRKLFENEGWERVCAFQTRNPMHRAHRELTVRAASAQNSKLLIHPVVGVTKPDDVEYTTRVRVYKAIMDTYPKGLAELSLLPLAMRMAGPREAVWHAIIRRNHGCSHFIVGRDHAGPGKDSEGNDFYGVYDAQELVIRFQQELEIQMVPFKMVAYLPDSQTYAPVDEIADGTRTQSISGTQLRRMLETGEDIPDWFTYPQVQSILRTAYASKRAANELKEQGIEMLVKSIAGGEASAKLKLIQADSAVDLTSANHPSLEPKIAVNIPVLASASSVTP